MMDRRLCLEIMLDRQKPYSAGSTTMDNAMESAIRFNAFHWHRGKYDSIYIEHGDGVAAYIPERRVDKSCS